VLVSANLFLRAIVKWLRSRSFCSSDCYDRRLHLRTFCHVRLLAFSFLAASLSLGERHWLRRDEADCSPDCRWHDYFHNSRTHSCAGILRIHEGAGITMRHTFAALDPIRSSFSELISLASADHESVGLANSINVCADDVTSGINSKCPCCHGPREVNI
jgi:hypothetical protein